jgi:replicative DNA helicase
MLVARCAQTGHVDEAMSKGIDASHFSDPECKMIWEFMREHTMKYNAPPSFAVVRNQFPQHNFEVVTDVTDYVLDVFVAAVNRREFIEALRELAPLVDDDTAASSLPETFLERARLLANVVPARRTGKFSTMRERIDVYRKHAAAGVSSGIPFGIPTIDKLTMGIQPHELVTISGWQGTGKSTLMQLIFFNAYMAGYTPLVFSLEMEEAAVMRMWDSMAAGVQRVAIKAGTLSPKDEQLWEQAADRAAKATNDIIVVDDVGRCTVDRIYADMAKYKPDIVGIDYVTLLHTRHGQSMWEKVTYLTQGLKNCARTLKIPIVAAAQLNAAGAKEGAELENIAYSKSIGQDSDIVLGLYQDKAMKANKRMKVRINKNREGDIAEVDMVWDHAGPEFREATPADMFQRVHASTP